MLEWYKTIELFLYEHVFLCLVVNLLFLLAISYTVNFINKRRSQHGAR